MTTFTVTLPDGTQKVVEAEYVIREEGGVSFLNEHPTEPETCDKLVVMYAAGHWASVEAKPSELSLDPCTDIDFFLKQ